MGLCQIEISGNALALCNPKRSAVRQRKTPRGRKSSKAFITGQPFYTKHY